MLEKILDVEDAAGVLVADAIDVSELERKVVTALIVAVMVPAVSGKAPMIPSHTLYPLCVCISTPRQFDITHCREPSPIVSPE